MSAFAKSIHAFWKNQRGNFALTLAVAMPALFGSAGLAVDYVLLQSQRSNIQELADAAALGTVKELSLNGKSQERMDAVAKNYVISNNGYDDPELKVETAVDLQNATIKVTLSQWWSPMMLHYIDAKALPIVVSATAKLTSSGNICMIGLDETGSKALELESFATMIGNNCGVYSNSDHKDSMKVDDGSEIQASFICSAGGIKNWDKASFEPTPVVDCPRVGDPLSSRKPPSYSGCDQHDLVIEDDLSAKLYPGVYCGGLSIKGKSEVTFKPGTYIILDGNFKVEGNSSANGTGVGFYIAGISGHGKKGEIIRPKMEFKKDTSISFSAPTSGAMAGILFMGDRLAGKDLDLGKVSKHKISSNNARTLLGTIYFPEGELEIDSDNKVADQSAYTAIIAESIKLKFGPTLVLNSDYEATNVPVPTALTGGKSMLVK